MQLNAIGTRGARVTPSPESVDGRTIVGESATDPPKSVPAGNERWIMPRVGFEGSREIPRTARSGLILVVALDSA